MRCHPRQKGFQRQKYLGRWGEMISRIAHSVDDWHTDPSTIIFAGFDNTATAISRLLWILSRVPEVQTILRSEIRKAKVDYGGFSESIAGWEDVDLPYDVLMGLPYLDAIVRETLRVFPATSILTRKWALAEIHNLFSVLIVAQNEISHDITFG